MSHAPTSTPPSTDAFAALGEFGAHVNIAEELFARATEAPERTAIRAPHKKRGWRDTSYAELSERTRAAAVGLAAAGVRPGDRACVFVRPGPELIQCTYALMALGAVPVLIDPGMGRKALLSCVQRMAPRVFLGVPEAQLARLLFRRAFKSVELCVHVGARVSLAGPSLAGLERNARDANFECVQSVRDDTAAILFTSGSTGPPKGVVYTHGMFEAQRRALRALFDLRAGEVDVACFPLFALFDTALGMTSVFPRLDPSRPGQCDPAQVVAAIEESGATLSFGSPAIWRRIAPWCRERGVVLEGLDRVLIAGAPVPPELVRSLRAILPEGADVYTPYGATEALPVACISGEEILRQEAQTLTGQGTCVGRLAPGIELAIVPIDDGELAHIDTGAHGSAGELGELCVRGPVVTQEYAEDAAATRLSKSMHPDGGARWHRMGDLGRIDEHGQLWFLGRKSHRLETATGCVPPVGIENIFNASPLVERTALVGVGAPGAQRALLVVEHAGAAPSPPEAETIAAELLAFGRAHGVELEIDHVLFHPGFPVDVRHNAKIHREELARWAEGVLA